ncbi:MAG: 2Fe-2S iron-sulfur cluster-binding protein, partial [bacterium]
MARKIVCFYINGSKYETAIREYDVLLDVLRENLNLIGTKRGCDMGTCGCCTVLIDGRA